MDIGVLKSENKEYLEQYEVPGFRSKSEMIDEALNSLRKKLKQKERREKILKAGISYANDNSYAWAGLDGDDFDD